MKSKQVLSIALTKGRLENSAVKRLEASGLDCSALKDKGRKLVIEIEDENALLRFVFAKAADTVTYVEYGVCDLGIVGRDTLLEAGQRQVYELADLGFGACRFALAAPEGKDVLGGYGTKVIASKYPAVARKFFEEKNMDVSIVRIEGSVELAPLLGLADGIIDLVETGATLRENGLAVLEYGADVSARLIAGTAALKLKKAAVDAFRNRLECAE